MALRGTLKDFGIADIFQLIGHQGKTGTLAIRNKDQTVKIHFKGGNVVGAESATREKKDRLGSMLIRAEAITEAELAHALETQKNTLKRLGELLIEQTSLDREILKAFMRLQTTETIYRLFLWDAGTYEFEARDVTVDPISDVIRSESVLMEGFRQVDEWPMIRRKLSGYGQTFERVQDLEKLLAEAGAGAEEEADDDLGLDDAFGEFDLDDSSSKDPRLKNIGENERLVYQLATDGRDVQKIIDLSRLGEFEACKALVNLLEAQILAPSSVKAHRQPSAEATVGGITSGRAHWSRLVIRASLLMLLAVTVGFGAWEIGLEVQQLLLPRAERGFLDVSLQEALTRAHVQRLREALEVSRVRTGQYPTQLGTLVEQGLIEPGDLRFPWRRPYAYSRVSPREYELLRPVY